MNIEAKGYTIELDFNELWVIAFSFKSALELTLKDHWIHHQDGWEKNEEQRLRLLKTMFNALGRNDVYEQIFKDAEGIFNK